MTGEIPIIKYDGLDASEHALDLRLLGESLTGIDRIASAGLITITTGRAPKKGERFPLRLKAREPEGGSVLIQAIIDTAAWTLPIARDVLQNVSVQLLTNWFGVVFNIAGGRPKEAEPHFVKLMEHTDKLRQDNADLQRALLKDRQDERRQTRKLIEGVIEKLHPHAKSAVSPVGPSCDSLQIGQEQTPRLLPPKVDAAMADAIRADEEDLEVGDMETMRLRVDGFIHHSRQLKVEDPNQTGRFITAEVRDPAFDKLPNVYSEAANTLGWLTVQAKGTRRHGELVKLHILNAQAA